MFLSALLAPLALNFVFAQEIAGPSIEQRMQERSEIVAKGVRTRRKSANEPGTAAYFLGIPNGSLDRDIRRLENYRVVTPNADLWSGYFFPNFTGGLGLRYGDPGFPKGDWRASRDYVIARPAASAPLNTLSPSEKYDFVMGVSPDDPGSLTSHQWRMGQAEYEESGTVATWQGICNGWAGASINFPAPQRSITFPTRRGNITFTPDDVEALGSLLYFNGRFESVYAGLRCNSDSPETSGTGRVMTPECFDVNPADWHLITTQHLGQMRQPFVIDSMQSSQVWNKPVVGYSFSYFDIGTLRNTSNTFTGVLRSIRDARNYRRGPYRSAETAWVVGVKMDVILMDGTPVGSANRTKPVTYVYDLELDANYQIVGGEWISQEHPDFTWRPKFARLPTTDGDSLTTTLNPWEANGSSQWRSAALMGNAHGAPLMKFVKYLFDYTSTTVSR